MRRPVVGDLVPRHRHRGRRLIDGVGFGPAGILIIPRAVGERPGIAVDPGVGVRHAAQVQAAEALAQHAHHRARRRMRRPVVGDLVPRHRHRRKRLKNATADGPGGIPIVPRRIGEGPGIGVSARIGVRRPAQIQATESLAQDSHDRARRRVRYAVIGDLVAEDRLLVVEIGLAAKSERREGLGDAVTDGPAGIVIVPRGVGEDPAIGIAAGVGMRRATQAQAA